MTDEADDSFFGHLGDLADETPPPPVRESCARCLRPTVTCLCDVLPAAGIPTATSVHVLVHPLELLRSTRTLPLVELCLTPESIRVVEGRRLRETPAPNTLLLFPGPDARDIEEFRGQGATHTLLVFDATWQYAKNMMTANRDRLGGVIQVQFRGETPVYREYTIRRQPKAACMSTLEAIAAALDVLEDNNVASTTMLPPLREMVRRQQMHIQYSDEDDDQDEEGQKESDVQGE